jgi:hypothetical protein
MVDVAPISSFGKQLHYLLFTRTHQARGKTEGDAGRRQRLKPQTQFAHRQDSPAALRYLDVARKTGR